MATLTPELRQRMKVASASPFRPQPQRWGQLQKMIGSKGTDTIDTEESPIAEFWSVIVYDRSNIQEGGETIGGGVGETSVFEMRHGESAGAKPGEGYMHRPNTASLGRSGQT